MTVAVPRFSARAQLTPLLVSLGALAAAVLVAMVVVAASGSPPGAALAALWQGAFGGRAQLAGTLSKTVPLLLVALGWIVAFTTRRVNIGFEGQILMGGLAATLVALGLDLPAPVHLPLAIAAGILGGAAYAGIAAALWARRGVNEIISTLMLNFVAFEVISWLVRGPMQESGGGFPRTDQIPASAAWPRVVPATALSWDLPLVVALAAAVALLVRNTTFGFQLRATGDNEEAARAAGIRTKRATVLALLVSGALAGLAGSSLILGGESGNMADNFSAGYGFEGIVVALLARNSPLACIPASLVLAALRQGGGLMESRVGVPSALVGITQGVIIVAIAGAAFFAERAAAERGSLPEAGDTLPVNA